MLTDQFGQIASALKQLEKDGHTKKIVKGFVFYNMIGNETIFPADKISDLCHELHPRLVCQLNQHYNQAEESVTLQDVYQFCHTDYAINSETRVVYIHSKGSYHSSAKNDNWRRELTRSLLHPDCLQPPDSQCDVCGVQFYTHFAFIFPGNMWTAKCSYIWKLLPPTKGGEYERRKVDSIKMFFRLCLWGFLDSTLNWDQHD